MFIIKYYVFAAIALFAMSFYVPSIYFTIILLWISLSLATVSLAYITDKPQIFRKKENGKIPVYIYWIFIPFLLGVQIYNSWARKNDSVPALQKIDEKLFLACRLFPSDMDSLKENGISAILDATAEFDGLNWSADDQDLAYLNIPILDHKTPHEEDLLHAVSWIKNQISQNKGVVVHCALGRGRSVLIVAAYLLANDKAKSVDEAMEIINSIRGTARLNSYQYEKLNDIYQSGNLNILDDMLIIANPVAGGGKWLDHDQTIINRLSSKFNVLIERTSETHSAYEIAKSKLDDYKYIIACGGDGTVNEVAKALIHKDNVLGIIPLGTTNALAHILYGNQSKISPVNTACNFILQRKQKRMDTAICNQDIVLLLAGIGVEQKMIEFADRDNKDQSGELAYLQGFVKSIVDGESQNFTIKIDDADKRAIEVNSLVVANAAPFTTVLAQGDGEPDPFDGKLDITIIHNTNTLSSSIASLGVRALANNSGDSEDIEHLRAEQIEITGDTSIKYSLDGEMRDATSIKIKIVPGSLNVLASE